MHIYKISYRFLNTESGESLLSGVVAIECCVSGPFYREHPSTTFLLGEPPIRGSRLEQIAELMRKEYHPQVDYGSILNNNSSNNYKVVVPNSSCYGYKDEILLFIPGFNSCLSNSTGMFGQFLALGGFPAQIVPWIFIWPMGAIPTYYSAKDVSESDLLASNLNKCLRDFLYLV